MERIPASATTKAPAEVFTGDVWFDVIVPTDGRAQGRCNSVHFSPGARTAWHRHVNGRLLRVIDGIGLTQSHRLARRGIVNPGGVPCCGARSSFR